LLPDKNQKESKMKIKSIIIPLISSLLIISLLLASCSTTKLQRHQPQRLQQLKPRQTPRNHGGNNHHRCNKHDTCHLNSTTVVNGTTTQNYTISQLKALPPTTGYGATKNKAGAITGQIPMWAQL